MRRFLALVTLLVCGWLGDAHAFQGVVTKGACYRYPDGAIVGGIGTQYETQAGCVAWTANYGASKCSETGLQGPTQTSSSAFNGYTNWNTYPFRQYWDDATLGGPNSCGSSHGGVVWREGGVAQVTCPANSTKNQSTGDCTCNANYHNEGASCVSNSCGANETFNGTTCECNAGYARFNGVCTTACPASGTAGPSLGMPATSSPGSTMCYNNCKYTFNTASNQYQSGGVQIWYGSTSSSGAFCSGGEVAASNPATAPPSCPQGQVPGTINGAFACLPSSDTNPAKTISSSSTTTTNASGGTTGTSTTTTTSTTGGGTTSTTTTTTDKDGAGNTVGGSSNTTTKPANDKPNEMSDFCKQNPTLAVCKTSSWSGACGAFTCDGDAVQCAIAKEIYTRNCALFNQSTPQSDLATAILAGNDPQGSQNPALESNRSNFSFTGAISQSPFLPQGGLTDQTIAFSGWSLVIPWSSLNQYLSIMGMIVVAFALVAATRIVMGRA